MNQAFPVDVELSGDEYRLRWDPSFASGAVDVFVGRDADSLPTGGTRFHTEAQEIRVPHVSGTRSYFLLQARGRAGLVVAERALPLEGGTNFRDLGGYLARDGRRVRWGRLYRSGHTAGLTQRDRDLIDALDIRVRCDFRRENELQTEKTALSARTRNVVLAIEPGSRSAFFEQTFRDGFTPAQTAGFMQHINREFVRHHAHRYAAMFRELLALEEGAFMINCAAGKDRTGFGAALILGALGVPRETLLADYLLSARYYPIDREMPRVIRKYGHYFSGKADPELMRPMMEARAEYLEAALDAIDEDHGSIEAYLEQKLGVGEEERDRLRERLLEAPLTARGNVACG